MPTDGTSPTDPVEPTEPPAPDPADKPKPPPGPVPYERFKEVNEQAKALQAQLAAIEKQRKEAEEAQLKEQEKWKELAEKREQELAVERANRQRLEIATRKGLPVDLATRLQGETPEEIEADAERLLGFMKPATGPGVPPPAKGGAPTAPELTKMSPAQIRKLLRPE